jgi:hypothetical protein
MPARIGFVCDGLTNAHLRHGDCPSGSQSGETESSAVLGISFGGCL